MQKATMDAHDALIALGLPSTLVHIPILGAQYLERMGGPPMSVYWPNAVALQLNDPASLLKRQLAEFYVVVNSIFPMLRHFGAPCSPNRPLEFDVAFMYFVKAMGTTTESVRLLATTHCYPDAFVVIRSLHSRVNLLTLFALGPHLHEEWGREPKQSRWLDGQVRAELAKYGIKTFPHFYQQFSEVVHAHHNAMEESGFMQNGYFSQIIAVENKILVGAKLLYGIVGHIGLIALKTWPILNLRDELNEFDLLFKHLIKHLCNPARWDHLPITIAEDRHHKVGGTKGEVTTIIDEWYCQENFEEQLALFSRKKQPKRLGKAYRKTRHST